MVLALLGDSTITRRTPVPGLAALLLVAIFFHVLLIYAHSTAPTSADRPWPAARHRWFELSDMSRPGDATESTGGVGCRMPQCARCSSRCVTDPANGPQIQPAGPCPPEHLAAGSRGRNRRSHRAPSS